jgi:hypothetical protein
LSLEFCDASVTVPELAIDPSDLAFTIRSRVELVVAPADPV